MYPYRGSRVAVVWTQVRDVATGEGAIYYGTVLPGAKGVQNTQHEQDATK